jgi:hypothetical protein
MIVVGWWDEKKAHLRGLASEEEDIKIMQG